MEKSNVSPQTLFLIFDDGCAWAGGREGWFRGCHARLMVGLAMVWLVLLPVVSLVAAPLAEQPPQPARGPGGMDYPHQGVTITRIGAYEDKFMLFEPSQPAPKQAPVVIFLHGWSSSKPQFYEGWIGHLCRKGNIVVFPCYESMDQPIDRYNMNVIRSVKEAFHVLVNGYHVEPDRDRVSVVGHESGGAIAANLAALAGYYKLPRPKALMILNPSRSPGGNLGGGIESFDLTRIPEGTLMLVAVGEDDFQNGEETARHIFYGADQVKSQDKNYLTFLTDIHGTSALVADRWAPLAPVDPIYQLEMDRRRAEFVATYKAKRLARYTRSRGIDAMDYLGYWRLFDSLMLVAFYHQDRTSVLGNTDSQRFMGKWSDGVPVRGLLATERP